MYYSFLYQGIFGLAFFNFLVFWTDLFFSTYLSKSSKNYLIPLQNSEQKLFSEITVLDETTGKDLKSKPFSIHIDRTVQENFLKMLGNRVIYLFNQIVSKIVSFAFSIYKLSIHNMNAQSNQLELVRGPEKISYLNQYESYQTETFVSNQSIPQVQNSLVNPFKVKIFGNHPFEILEFFTSTILWFLLTSLLFYRYLKSNHFPLANFYEALIFLTWCLVTLNFFLLFGPFGNSVTKRRSENQNDLILNSDKSLILNKQPINDKSESNFLKFPIPLKKVSQNSLWQKSSLFEGAYRNKKFGNYNKFLDRLSKPQKKIYGGILAPCILFIIAFAQFNLSSEFSPLVPALKSNWLLMHVSIMIFSYTIFIVAGLISLILIIQKYQPSFKLFYKNLFDRSHLQGIKFSNHKTYSFFPSFSEQIFALFRKRSGKKEERKNSFYLGTLQNRNQIDFFWDYTENPTISFLPQLLEKTCKKNQITEETSNLENYVPHMFLDNPNRKMINFKVPKQVKHKEPSIKISQQMQKNYFSITLDQISYRLFGIGFPLFTLGILSGAVWANSAWGSYWSWDIKETGSFINWLTITLYLHCRYKNFITLSHVIGFFSIIILFFNFFGISLGIFGSSLHAYGAAS